MNFLLRCVAAGDVGWSFGCGGGLAVTYQGSPYSILVESEDNLCEIPKI
jgi:hypothetical protein